MLRISDLWNAAFLVSGGAEIKDLIVTNFNNQKKSVYFVFNNPKAEKLNQQFISGKATANVIQLKSTMNHLKDLLFAKIRENNQLKTY